MHTENMAAERSMIASFLNANCRVSRLLCVEESETVINPKEITCIMRVNDFSLKNSAANGETITVKPHKMTPVAREPQKDVDK